MVKDNKYTLGLERFTSGIFLVCFLLPLTSFATNNTDSLYTNANAIILSEVKKVDFKKQNAYVLYHKKTVKILNKKAESYQTIFLHYKSGSDKIKDLKIRVLDVNGKVIKKVSSSEVNDIASGDGYSIITDYRAKYWSYNTKDYPIIIEFEYQKHSSNTLALPQWAPITNYNTSIVESSYQLITSSEIRSKELNLSGYSSISISGYSYNMQNQVAVRSERYSPPITEILPIVIFLPQSFEFEGVKGEYSSWEDYGHWVNKSFLSEKTFENKESILSDLSGVITYGDEPITVCKKLYKYLQDNTRYVSVSLDEGGLNPMHPDKVHDVKYGDCKALSFYMKSLLDLYDIESNYVEVAAESDYNYDMFEDFPSPFPGNHIILNIPLDNDTLWVDCTSHNNPFNFLGSFTDNRTVLEINNKGGHLTHTPYYGVDQNKKIDTITIDIRDEASYNTNIIKYGYGLEIESMLWLSQKPNTEIEEYIKVRSHNALSIKDISHIRTSIDYDEMYGNLTYDIQSDNYIESASGYLFIPNKILALDIPKLPKDGKREHKIYFPRPSVYYQTVIINSDVSYSLIDTESIEHSSKYGEYKYEIIENDEKQIVINKSFSLYEGSYTQDEYDKIKLFFDKCRSKEISPLTLKQL